MNNLSGALLAVVLVVIVAALVWVAYSQGFLTGQVEDKDGLEIKVGEIGGSQNGTD